MVLHINVVFGLIATHQDIIIYLYFKGRKVMFSKHILQIVDALCCGHTVAFLRRLHSDWCDRDDRALREWSGLLSTGVKETWEIGRFSMKTRRYVGKR